MWFSLLAVGVIVLVALVAIVDFSPILLTMTQLLFYCRDFSLITWSSCDRHVSSRVIFKPRLLFLGSTWLANAQGTLSGQTRNVNILEAMLI